MNQNLKWGFLTSQKIPVQNFNTLRACRNVPKDIYHIASSVITQFYLSLGKMPKSFPEDNDGSRQ